MESNLPFKGLKILELSSVLAGPLAGSFFAEGGAEVIKIEHPTHGDVTRSWLTKSETTGSGTSSYYAAANTFKKVLKLDLASEEGQSQLQQYISSCDILLQNFKGKDLIKFNLTPKTLALNNPNLVHIRLVGFSNEPTRLAYDVVVQAETGFMHLNGSADGPPTKLPVAFMDILASDQIRSAALTGLYARATGTRGWYAEVSLEKSSLAAYGEILSVANDVEIVLAVGSDSQFHGLCSVLELTALSRDDRFSSNKLRVENRIELLKLLKEAARKADAGQLMSEFLKYGVPAGVIKSLEEVFSQNSAASKSVITEIAPGSNQQLRKVSTTAYSITVFGNNKS
jgi:crotonobetainyl-CoA:carnitine CoA-transferase CaiB-like acyl-CoA transferase